MTNENFETWRSQLHTMQLEIDACDEAFWEAYCDTPDSEWDQEAFDKAEAAYKIQRAALVEKMEAHARYSPLTSA